MDESLEHHLFGDERPAQFIVRPNRSLSRQGMVLAYLFITAVVLMIAAVFTVLGAWLILPFSGLEALLFGGAFLWFHRHYDDHEYIVINGDTITVTSRAGDREDVYVFQRYWARLTVEIDPRSWRPPHLILGSHGTRLEIASHLSAEERLDFARHLRAALSLASAPPPVWRRD